MDAQPLNWWKENSFQFTKLSKLAEYYLCIQASSSHSEREFSKAGNTKTLKRVALAPHKLSKLAMLRSNKDL